MTMMSNSAHQHFIRFTYHLSMQQRDSKNISLEQKTKSGKPLNVTERNGNPLTKITYCDNHRL